MLFQGYVDQDIPVRPDLVITFRTVTTQQGLWMEEYAARQDFTANHHAAHWFSLLQIAVSLQSLNGKLIGSDLSRIKDKEHFWKAVEERMNAVGKYPGALTDDFIVQYTWFTGRVRKLLAGNLARKVGNS
jgi:hypothetical protein